MEDIRKNNQTQVPLEHYRSRLLAQEPEEIRLRTGAEFSEEAGEFYLTLLGKAVRIQTEGQPDASLAFYAGSGEPLHGYEEILMLRFLLDGRYMQTSGKFLAYDEMPWGEVYLPNFRGRCILRLAGWAGRDMARFESAAVSMGGKRVCAGSAAFDVEFMDELSVRLIIWEGDEEFPSSAQILFSDNFPYAFGAEDMAVIGDLVIGALKKAA